MNGVRPSIVECWVYRVGIAGPPDILLIRRAPGRIFAGLWQCVTGRLEPDERVPLGALREAREETGLRSSDVEAFYDLDLVAQFYAEESDAIVMSAMYAIRVGPGFEPRLSEEHDDHRWLEPVEALRLAVWPAYDEAIRRIGTHLLDPELAPWFQLSLDGRRLAR